MKRKRRSLKKKRSKNQFKKKFPKRSFKMNKNLATGSKKDLLTQG